MYYFGVQGGIRQFEEYLHRTSLFKSRVIRTIDARKTNLSIHSKDSFGLFRCETRNSGNNSCIIKFDHNFLLNRENERRRKEKLRRVAEEKTHEDVYFSVIRGVMAIRERMRSI